MDGQTSDERIVDAHSSDEGPRHECVVDAHSNHKGLRHEWVVGAHSTDEDRRHENPGNYSGKNCPGARRRNSSQKV